MLHAARQRLEQREKELLAANPRLHQLMVLFTTAVAEEQERAKLTMETMRQQARDASVASVLRLRRMQAKRQLRHQAQKRGSRHSSLGMGLGLASTGHHGLVRYDSSQDASLVIEGGEPEASHASVLRAETLLKQGYKDLAVWTARYFVLQPDGLYYYESEDARKAGKPARGRVQFLHMQCVSGQAADTAPRFMFMLLGKSNVFVVHKEESTYVMSAPSKESLKAWVGAINAAYDSFVAQQARRAALMENAWLVGSTDVWNVVEQLERKHANLDQAVGEILAALESTFEDEVAALRENYVLRRSFLVWKVFAQAKSNNQSRWV